MGWGGGGGGGEREGAQTLMVYCDNSSAVGFSSQPSRGSWTCPSEVFGSKSTSESCFG